MTRLPSFIIVGAMKCATSTLQKQLSLQPGIFMTTPKEPNFFSDDPIYAKGIDWYKNLYAEAAENSLLGEASTHYTKLPTYPNTIQRLIKHCNSDLKIIYIIRNPIDRLISHYLHEKSMRKITCDVTTAVEKHPELVEYSLYHYQISPYLESFRKSNVLLMCHERISAEPEEQLSLAAKFIGYPKDVFWVSSESRQNVSSERIRRFPGYEFIVGNPVLERLRRKLVPTSIRHAIKERLTVGERPELSSATTTKLTEIFDKDLRELGSLLGFNLSCASYPTFSQRPAHEWL